MNTLIEIKRGSSKGDPLWYSRNMNYLVDIIGAGLAGSEAALQLAQRNIQVRLIEMRPVQKTPVHTSDKCGELVCSNSLKSMKPESAAGMLKSELKALNSQLLSIASDCAVAAGGALAVDREQFSEEITSRIKENPNIELLRAEVLSLTEDAQIVLKNEEGKVLLSPKADAVILATGPLTSDALAESLQALTGSDQMAFYDAAAPIVMADSLNYDILFRQSRYEDNAVGDYLNAPFSKEEYEHFIEELLAAKRVISKDFETKDLFQACQPIEEIARKGVDAPRFGPLKPVGLQDPRTGHRPWAALQLRAEDAYKNSYNLVGFQTNLTFPEQKRIFRMIPGLEEAEFARYGVMHRNTFIQAPQLLTKQLRLRKQEAQTPIYVAGQLAGTEGYCEAMISGLYVALCCVAQLQNKNMPNYPADCVFGSLLDYATNPETKDYQPMHVNFGIVPPLEKRIRNKQERYAQYKARGDKAMQIFVESLQEEGLL